LGGIGPQKTEGRRYQLSNGQTNRNQERREWKTLPDARIGGWVKEGEGNWAQADIEERGEVRSQENIGAKMELIGASLQRGGKPGRLGGENGLSRGTLKPPEGKTRRGRQTWQWPP